MGKMSDFLLGIRIALNVLHVKLVQIVMQLMQKHGQHDQHGSSDRPCHDYVILYLDQSRLYKNFRELGLVNWHNEYTLPIVCKHVAVINGNSEKFTSTF